MINLDYRLHDVALTEMTPGQDFRIPDSAPKYFPNLIYNYSDGSGEFITKSELVHYIEDVYSDRTYFKAINPGYAAFGFAYQFGTEYDYAVKIVDHNGEAPYSPPPVSSDDHIIYSYADEYGHTISELMANDQVSILNLAINVESRPISNDLVFYAEPYENWLNVGVSGESWDSIQLGTRVGEYRIEDLSGTWGNWAKVYVDVIGWNASRDHIEAYDTNDTIDFSLSSDSVGVYGLGGDDIIRGSQANDKLYGGDGNDRIGGKSGNDIIDGGAGNDTLFGDGGNDTIDGGTGNDVIWGGEGHDILRGGAGHDQIYGDSGNDQIGGKAGNDVLHGGDGNDTIWGDDGNDILYGDAGNDNLNGGSGDDLITGGLGIDRMRGEAGTDTFILIRGEAQGDTILDFEGAGVSGGDKIEFRGYGKDATVHHVSDDTWQIDGAGISETFKIAGVSSLGGADFYFV